jgi:hypothetical protein
VTSYITSTSGAETNPDLVLGYQASRAVPSIAHRIIGRGDPDITLVPAGLRTGTLELFYTDETEAWSALDLLSQLSTFEYTEDQFAELAMTFVVLGAVQVRLDNARWIVTVDYTEVSA